MYLKYVLFLDVLVLCIISNSVKWRSVLFCKVYSANRSLSAISLCGKHSKTLKRGRNWKIANLFLTFTPGRNRARGAISLCGKHSKTLKGGGIEKLQFIFSFYPPIIDYLCFWSFSYISLLFTLQIILIF